MYARPCAHPRRMEQLVEHQTLALWVLVQNLLQAFSTSAGIVLAGNLGCAREGTVHRRTWLIENSCCQCVHPGILIWGLSCSSTSFWYAKSSLGMAYCPQVKSQGTATPISELQRCLRIQRSNIGSLLRSFQTQISS